MNKSPEERVQATLTLAREMAWDAFEDPSEMTVMALFRRLCDERDMDGMRSEEVEPVDGAADAAAEAARRKRLH